MKAHKLFLIGLLASAVALTACGGGGGGGAPAPVVGGPVAGTTFEQADLAPLDATGTFDAAIAINNNGRVVGVSDDSFGIQGVAWNISAPAIPILLAPMGADIYSAAYGLNDGGIAVGESGTIGVTAVYWDTNVPVPAPLALDITGLAGDNTAYGINTIGEIVGEADDGLGSLTAVYWPGVTGVPVVLDDLGGNPGSSAYFINDNGTIVGESTNSSGQLQAVAWVRTGPGAYGAPVLLGAVTGQVASVAFGVDNAGNIVGEAELDTGAVQVLVWNTAGAVVTNAGPDTSVQAISPAAGSNRIVGYVDALSGADRSAIWNLASLNDRQVAAVPFSQAYGVNNASHFVGVMDNRAFVQVAQ